LRMALRQGLADRKAVPHDRVAAIGLFDLEDRHAPRLGMLLDLVAGPPRAAPHRAADSSSTNPWCPRSACNAQPSRSPWFAPTIVDPRAGGQRPGPQARPAARASRGVASFAPPSYPSGRR